MRLMILFDPSILIVYRLTWSKDRKLIAHELVENQTNFATNKSTEGGPTHFYCYVSKVKQNEKVHTILYLSWRRIETLLGRPLRPPQWHKVACVTDMPPSSELAEILCKMIKRLMLIKQLNQDFRLASCTCFWVKNFKSRKEPQQNWSLML